MAVIVKNTEEKEMKIVNTDITIDDVYVRLTFFAKANGKNVEVELIPYTSKQHFIDGLQINNVTLPRTVEGDVENQNLADVHTLVKTKLEELGFDVEIDLEVNGDDVTQEGNEEDSFES